MIVKDWCDCNDCGICVDACPLAALEIEEK